MKSDLIAYHKKQARLKNYTLKHPNRRRGQPCPNLYTRKLCTRKLVWRVAKSLDYCYQPCLDVIMLMVNYLIDEFADNPQATFRALPELGTLYNHPKRRSMIGFTPSKPLKKVMGALLTRPEISARIATIKKRSLCRHFKRLRERAIASPSG